ncbi:unnamed protein product [Discosporangium mesarthrocarpum]
MHKSKHVTDRQLVRGLLPDAYFQPVIESLRVWVLDMAFEFDHWVQKVTLAALDKSREGHVRSDVGGSISGQQ